MFLDAIKKAADEFKKVEGPVRVISHLDADGITAAAILTKALQREERKFSLSILKHLNKQDLEEINKEDYKTIIFCDMGSGYLRLISEIIKDKKVFILGIFFSSYDL